MTDRKKKAKLIILLGINTMLSIIGVMSIPFIMLGVAWTLKPELTT
jgi:hypothetical protein